MNGWYSFAETNGYAMCEPNAGYKTLAERGSNRVVAMPSEMLSGHLADYCGKEVKVTWNGRTVDNLVIWDGCAACNGAVSASVVNSLAARNVHRGPPVAQPLFPCPDGHKPASSLSQLHYLRRTASTSPLPSLQRSLAPTTATRARSTTCPGRSPANSSGPTRPETSYRAGVPTILEVTKEKRLHRRHPRESLLPPGHLMRK